MRIFWFILCVLVFCAAPVQATQELSCEDGESVTGTTWYHAHCYTDTDTDTDTDTIGEPQNEVGVGTDVVLWANEDEDALVDEVVAEYRYAMDNETHALYGVVRLNLWDKIKGLFGGDAE